MFNCGFLDLSPGAGEWGRGRLTVSPRNQRGGSFLWVVLFVYFRAFDLRTCLRRTVRRKKQGRAAALRERLHSLWSEKVGGSFFTSINESCRLLFALWFQRSQIGCEVSEALGNLDWAIIIHF